MGFAPRGPCSTSPSLGLPTLWWVSRERKRERDPTSESAAGPPGLDHSPPAPRLGASAASVSGLTSLPAGSARPPTLLPLRARHERDPCWRRRRCRRPTEPLREASECGATAGTSAGHASHAMSHRSRRTASDGGSGAAHFRGSDSRITRHREAREPRRGSPGLCRGRVVEAAAFANGGGDRVLAGARTDSSRGCSPARRG